METSAMPDETVYEYLKAALCRAIELKFPSLEAGAVAIVIEKPKQKSFGDLSSPVALSLGKLLRTNPAAVAHDIMSVFPWNESYVEPDVNLSRSVVAGFINFRLNRPYLFSTLAAVVRAPERFGRRQSGRQKKMLFEFVSANPTGPMVVVGGRAAAIGDVVARLNEWLGNSVEREFYVNDFGNQVELLGKSIACRYFQEKGESACEIPEGGYEGD